jgi:hypothetical protein
MSLHLYLFYEHDHNRIKCTMMTLHDQTIRVNTYLSLASPKSHCRSALIPNRQAASKLLFSRPCAPVCFTQHMALL